MKKLFLSISFLLLQISSTLAMHPQGIGSWMLTKAEQLKTLNAFIEKNELLVDAIIHAHNHTMLSHESMATLQAILKICRTHNLEKIHDKIMSHAHLLSAFRPTYSSEKNSKPSLTIEDPTIKLATSWIWNSSHYLEKDIELMITNDSWPLIFSETTAPIGTLSWMEGYNELSLALGNKLTFLFNAAQLLGAFSIKTGFSALINLNLSEILKTFNQETVGRYISTTDMPLLLDEYKKSHTACKKCCNEHILPKLDDHTNHVLQNIPLTWSGTLPELMIKAIFFLKLAQQFESNSKTVRLLTQKHVISILQNRNLLLEFKKVCIKHMETIKDFTDNRIIQDEKPTYFL